MSARLFRSWWAFVLRGLIAVVFGILALLWPQATMLSLVLVFGAFALVDAFFTLTRGLLSMGSYDRWWVGLRVGLVGFLIGLSTLFWPAKTAVILFYSIAIWTVIVGVLDLMAATQLRHVIPAKWMLFLCGSLSVLWGVLLFVLPGAGTASLVWVIEIFALALGSLLMILGLHLRDLGLEFQGARISGASARLRAGQKDKGQ